MSNMVSYFDKDLGLSLEMPTDWDAGQSEVFPLVLLAPEAQGYRSNLGFDRTATPVPDPARMEELIEETKRDQRAEYPNFRQIEEEQLHIDRRPAYWQRYTWQPAGEDRRYAQVFGLIAVGPEQLIDFHAATLAEMEDELMPIFRHIVESIRFIPGQDQ